MSQQQNKKPNNNPTYGVQGADIPVLIYINKQELDAFKQMSQMLREGFKKQKNPHGTKTPDIREFVKFATMTYYNMVVMQVREQQAQLQKKQNVVRKPLVNDGSPTNQDQSSDYNQYV